MSDWTQDHYVTRNSTTDDPSGYRVWLTCRCGWDSGTLVDGFMPTTHRAELEHYVSVAPLAEVRRQAAEEALLKAADAFEGGEINIEIFGDSVEARLWRMSNQTRSSLVKSLRARAAAYRREETE